MPKEIYKWNLIPTTHPFYSYVNVPKGPYKILKIAFQGTMPCVWIEIIPPPHPPGSIELEFFRMGTGRGFLRETEEHKYVDSLIDNALEVWHYYYKELEG